MSVHELKRPSTANVIPVEWRVNLPDALEHLRHWAQVSPLQTALRHKRRGQWYVWRWIDALRDVERLADGLRQQGFTEHSRLALSGPFEPNLLLLALAAQSIGGQLLTLADDLDREALHSALWRSRPSHAFVHGGQQLQHWLAAVHTGAPQPLLIVNQRAPRQAQQSVLSFAELLGPVETPQRLSRWRQVLAAGQLWSEEGTQWQNGLSVLFEQWLASGQCLAFAESPGSASRDRREAVPSGLLLSAERLQHLANEIESRLAPPGSWRRRLCDWAIANPQKGVQRLIKNRVRRLLGFQHLHFIWQACGGTAKTSAPAWLAEFKRNIA